jgi:hypothetical protein
MLFRSFVNYDFSVALVPKTVLQTPTYINEKFTINWNWNKTGVSLEHTHIATVSSCHITAWRQHVSYLTITAQASSELTEITNATVVSKVISVTVLPAISSFPFATTMCSNCGLSYCCKCSDKDIGSHCCVSVFRKWHCHAGCLVPRKTATDRHISTGHLRRFSLPLQREEHIKTFIKFYLFCVYVRLKLSTNISGCLCPV